MVMVQEMCKKIYIPEKHITKDMGEIPEEVVKSLSETRVPYAVIGHAGFYFHLNERKGSLVEVVANAKIPGTTLIDRDDMGPLAKHYEAIIDTAEEVPVGKYTLKVASISYLVADNRIRNLTQLPFIAFAKSGRIDRALTEDVRCMYKALGLKEEHWPDFLQFLYDFAPRCLHE